jgi:hypothetical protein
VTSDGKLIQVQNGADAKLMEEIRAKWGQEIARARLASSVPESFLAALVANESGGDPNAHRFEKGVLHDIWEVLQGRSQAYGSIKRVDLLNYLMAPVVSLPVGQNGVASIVSGTLLRVDGLATSWGLTQIMGYETLPLRTTIADLRFPASSLRETLRILADFANRWQLDLASEFAELFRCWNTGRPHNATTADPNYVPNGIARMKIYETLPQNPPKAISA